MNAIIGMWLIFKITGWLEGSFIGYIGIMGNTYMEIFSSFCIKVFNWIYELFDSKVVPEVPNKTNNPFT